MAAGAAPTARAPAQHAVGPHTQRGVPRVERAPAWCWADPRLGRLRRPHTQWLGSAPPTFSQSTPDTMNNPTDFIYRYTRAQALADGTLTSANIGDLAAVTAQHFAGLTPIASVVVAYYLMADMRAAARDGFDITGIWHDILVVATAASNPPMNGNLARVFYDCLSNGPRRWSCTVRIGGHHQTRLILHW